MTRTEKEFKDWINQADEQGRKNLLTLAEIHPGDFVEFNPLPNRKIDSLSGVKKVLKVTGSNRLIWLECGNIQLAATLTECVKVSKKID